MVDESFLRFITKLFGLKIEKENELSRSEEELRIILSESYESGEINQSEYKYVTNIFDFDERMAKEIMVPRTEMVTIPMDASKKEVLAIIEKEKLHDIRLRMEIRTILLGLSI